MCLWVAFRFRWCSRYRQRVPKGSLASNTCSSTSKWLANSAADSAKGFLAWLQL